MGFNQLELIFVVAINVLCVVLALAIYFSNKKSLANLYFSVLALLIILWIDSGFLATLAGNYALILTKINVGVIPLCFIVAFFFINYFVGKKPSNSIISFAVVCSGLIFTFLTISTSLIVKDIRPLKWGVDMVAGGYAPFYYAWVGLMIVPIFYFLLQKYESYDVENKTKVIYFIIGFVIFTVFNLVFNVIFPVIRGTSDYYQFGDYSVVFLLGFTAYAIVKHQLFNIKVIATETAAIVINIVLIVQIFNSANATEAILTVLFWLIVLYVSYILVKSVQREIKFREELQVLSHQLVQANTHLKELDAMKTEFVSLASHELLTPVSAIEGYLSMLLDEHMAKVEDPKALKYLTNVYSSAKRLARLIADMLNISRIEEGRLLVEKKDVDLSELIKQVVDEIKFKSEERKQKVVFENDVSHPESREGSPANAGSETSSEILRSAQNDKYVTYADADKIKEVIINLIGNSIKYSRDPGTITVRVEKVPTARARDKWQKIEDDIKARPLDDQEAINSSIDSHYRDFVGEEQLMVQVIDQGIGIPKEELPRLFKKFHRVGNYSTQESQGTGLGLYISRALVELHHGRIWADSEGEGKGSTFTFTLPDLSDKKALLELEAQAPKQKESLKPLARPTKAAEEL